MASAASTIHYPEEQVFLRFGATTSLGLHLFVAGLVALVAFLTHIKTIQQLMAEGGSIAQSGPAPEEQMEVLLRPEDLPPPPPTPNPEFIRQVEKPKPVVVPPPPAPVTPRPRPVLVAKPRFTAPKATGTGESSSVSRLVIGSSGFPKPSYPYDALVRHQSGTVEVAIQFDGTGRVEDVDVVQSSGVTSLDNGARKDIRAYWHDERFAGQRVTVPIEYDQH
jgi:TonB family protein